MRNIDNSNALVFKSTDQCKELSDLLTGEIGRGFVEDEKASATRRGTGGRDQLLLTNGEGRQERSGRQIKADIVENFLGVSHHRAVLEQPITHFFVTEKQVGGNGEMRTKHDLLVHRIDSVFDSLLWRGERNRPAFPINISTGPQVDAGK